MRVEQDLKNLEGLHWKLQGHCGGLWLEGEKNAQVSESRLSVHMSSNLNSWKGGVSRALCRAATIALVKGGY